MIETADHHILLEAGPTVLCALKRMGFSPADIDIILVSHLHGDHFAGLPFLVLEYLWETRRRKIVKIAGPPHLEERTWRLFNTMFPYTSGDVEQVRRILRFNELKAAQRTRLGPVEIETLRVPHMKREPSFALKIAVAGKTIVFSGDTGWTDRLLDFTAGSDLFLCECTYFENNLDIHLNYPLLDSKRHCFDVKRMVLTHVGREVLERRSEVSMEVADDGMELEV